MTDDRAGRRKRKRIRVRVDWAPWPGREYRCFKALPPDRPGLADMGDSMCLVDVRGKGTALAPWRPGLPTKKE